MIKKLLFLLLFIPIIGLAQGIERTSINGIITAPTDEDVEGINIYNVSSQKGTITDKDGNFELVVAENDRIQITAIQFQSFTVIVDEGVIESKQLRIYMNPAINQLEEVIVRPYDLTGNVKVDVGKIKTVDFDSKITMDYEDVEFNYGFLDDSQSSIRGNAAIEAYYNGQNPYGGNILGLAGLLFNGKKNKKNKNAVLEKGAVAKGLRQRFSNHYISNTFQIPEQKAGDFILYLEDNGIDSALLKAENEIELLQFMFEKVTAYKKLGK